MRILFINHTGKASGAESVLLSLISRLEGYTIRLLCPPGELHDRAQCLGIPVGLMDEVSARFTLRPDRLLTYLASLRRAIRQIRDAVREWKPELVHANTVRAGIAATMATAGMPVKVVWHVHDILPRHPLSSAIRLLFLLSGRAYALCVSHATARRFRGVALQPQEIRRRIYVLHNGIDPSTYRPHTRAMNLREELGVGSGAFLVAIVGQLTPRKATGIDRGLSRGTSDCAERAVAGCRSRCFQS